MSQAAETELLQRVWDYPLFAALYGRRSRRFGLGFEIAEGPLRYRSRHAALPLDEFEEALLVAAGPRGSGRLAIPRRVPPLFGHNMWDCNMPGTTLFMPVCDVSLTLISLILNLVDGEAGRYVRGHGGGMNIVDDRRGGRPAGTEAYLARGLIDREKILPLSILERQACYFMFSEPAVICHNIFLATEAMGLGGWMHCGFLSLEVMRLLGFRTVAPDGAAMLAN